MLCYDGSSTPILTSAMCLTKVNDCAWEWDWERLLKVITSRGMLDMTIYVEGLDDGTAAMRRRRRQREARRQEMIEEGLIPDEELENLDIEV
jgi:hypothetical protein